MKMRPAISTKITAFSPKHGGEEEISGRRSDDFLRFQNR
jgi:hypothetical protein